MLLSSELADRLASLSASELDGWRANQRLETSGQHQCVYLNPIH